MRLPWSGVLVVCAERVYLNDMAWRVTRKMDRICTLDSVGMAVLPGTDKQRYFHAATSIFLQNHHDPSTRRPQ
ncbi:hypothetical protein HDK64DRAFT_264193 [Phyllosticta capitalensis]